MRKLIFTIVAFAAGSVFLLAQPVITIQPTNQTVFYRSSVRFNVAATGTGPLTYQWQFNGTNLPNNIITTVAGNGFGSPFSGNYSGDGGAATNASLYFPSGVALDAVGNLYIADTSNNRIRKMDTNGIITTVVGNGSSGFSGDGGNATNASLSMVGGLGQNAVAGLCFDRQGNLYIADAANNRIRRVDTNGIINTVAGNGAGGYSGDGGQSTNASLSGSAGVASDRSGDFYIADTGNSRIRKVDTNGIINTFAGGGGISGNLISGASGPFTATDVGLNSPYGVAVDTNGNVYIADTYDKRIERVDTNGILTIIAGYGILEAFSGDGGPSTNAQIIRPKGVAVDPNQNLNIIDTLNHRIRLVDSNGIINTVVGSSASGLNGAFSGDGGLATNCSLADPRSVTFDASGNMYIADCLNNRIRFIPFGGLPNMALNNVSLTNNGNYRVVITDSSGSVTSSIVSLTVLVPAIINIQPVTQTLVVGSNAILSVDAYGTPPLNYQWLFNGSPLDSQTNSMLTMGSVTTNQSGNYKVIVTNLYGSATSSVATLLVGNPPAITNQSSNQIVLVGGDIWLTASVTGSSPLTYQWQLNGTNLPNKVITTVAGKSGFGFSGDNGAATNATLNAPAGLTTDAAGNIFIADTSNNRIRKVDASGIITTVAGKNSSGFAGDGLTATNATLSTPAGIVLDSHGNMFIADSLNNRVRKVDAGGIIQTLAGTNTSGFAGDGGAATNSKLNTARAVAFDNSGNLYIADTFNSRIRRVNTNGIITTTAGTNNAGFSGDGGVATIASLNFPYGVIMDGQGNLYIADTRNNRIRKMGTNGIISTVAGKGPVYPSPGSYSGDGGYATNAFLNNPHSVATDPLGNIFIADAGNNRIRKVDTSGIITTVAGKSSQGFSGDGGTATNASLSDPEGVAFDPVGNLLIADTSNQRIRKVFLYAGYNTLYLRNLKSKDAGNYTLVVTSPFGSVTSSIVSLNLQLPPIVPTFTANNSTFNFTWNAVSTFTYQLQYATNLAVPVWQNLGSPITATNGTVSASDIPGGDLQRFYRVQLVQ